MRELWLLFLMGVWKSKYQILPYYFETKNNILLSKRVFHICKLWPNSSLNVSIKLCTAWDSSFFDQPYHGLTERLRAMRNSWFPGTGLPVKVQRTVSAWGVAQNPEDFLRKLSRQHMKESCKHQKIGAVLHLLCDNICRINYILVASPLKCIHESSLGTLRHVVR